MKWHLDPRLHGQVARALLTREFGETLGATLAEAFDAGELAIAATTIGWDKDGPYETDEGACLRGYDDASDYLRVRLTIAPRKERSVLAAEEYLALAAPAARPARTGRIPAWLRPSGPIYGEDDF